MPSTSETIKLLFASTGHHGQLDDLDFAGDLALLSYIQQQMQDCRKITIVSENSKRLGLNIRSGKSNVLKINTESVIPIKLEGDEFHLSRQRC